MNYGLSVRPSVFLSFRLSVWKFPWDWLISFSKTQHGVKGPCVVVRDRADMFFKIFFLFQKWGKWSKNRVFSIYWKI